MSEYISIKEFASRAGITPQAVYKQLDNKLQTYCKVVDGKKTLHLSALELFENNQVNKPDNNELLNELSSVVNLLKGQLAEKDKQLEAKDKQITALTEALQKAQQITDQAQHLQANSEQRLLALQAPKKHWWSFGKSKDNEQRGNEYENNG